MIGAGSIPPLGAIACLLTVVWGVKLLGCGIKRLELYARLGTPLEAGLEAVLLRIAGVTDFTAFLTIFGVAEATLFIVLLGR